MIFFLVDSDMSDLSVKVCPPCVVLFWIIFLSAMPREEHFENDLICVRWGTSTVFPLILQTIVIAHLLKRGGR